MDQQEKNAAPLATEIMQELKGTIRFYKILVIILVALLAATNIFHIWQWSQFDTIVVDSGDGSGSANYVQGDNTGGIYNGEGGSQTPEEG